MHFWKFSVFFLLSLNAFAQKTSPKTYWNQANLLPKAEASKKLELYLKAESVAEKSKMFEWQANVCPDICGSYFEMGDYDKATKICLKGLNILKKHNIRVDSIAFKLHSSLATCYNRTYRIMEALKEFDVANSIVNINPAVDKQTPLFAAYHYSNQAHLLIELFEVEQAKVLYEKALRIAKNLPKKTHYAFILGDLSLYYRFQGQPQNAVNVLEEALGVVGSQAELGITEISNMYFNLGSFYLDLEKFDLAKLNFKKSKRSLRGTLTNDYIFRADVNIARVSLFKGDINKSLSLLRNIRMDLLRDKENIYNYYLTLGDAYFGINDNSLAMSSYQKAFSVLFPNQQLFTFEPKDIVVYRLRLYEVLGKLSKTLEINYIRSKNIEDLLKGYTLKNKQLEVGKTIRAFQENLDSKLFFTDRYHKNYLDAIKIGFEIYAQRPQEKRKNELFLLAEEAKSISLDDNLLLRNRTRDSLTDSLTAKLNAYQSYLSYLKNQDQKDKGQINDYELKVGNLIKELKKSSLAFYQTVYSPYSKTSPSVPEGVLYLNFLVSDSELFVFSKNGNIVNIFKTKINVPEFQKNVTDLTLALQNKPSPLAGFSKSSICKYFFNLLLLDTQVEFQKFKRLVINPDNSFYGISFDILQNPTNGRYLIETHAISYANNLRQAVSNKKIGAGASQKWITFFPFSSNSLTLISGLKPLKYSLKEVKGILAEVFIDQKANKQEFIKTLVNPKPKVLMIATHAEGNDQDPYIVFDNNTEVSSRLYVSELRQMKVTSPLVILSACETNKGKTLNGLGVMSFAKTLSWAGCPAVVGTLWNVEDQSMSVLASIFYRNLQDGMDKDVALQQAKLSFLNTDVGKRNDLPFYWAHLQVMGSSDPIVEKTSLNYYLLTLLVFVFISIAAYVNYLLKRSALTRVES